MRIGQTGLGLPGQPEAGAGKREHDREHERSDDRFHEPLLRETSGNTGTVSCSTSAMLQNAVAMNAYGANFGRCVL